MNPYLDIILRSVAVYIFMLVAIRVFGKKELSQLNTADIILILLISNSVQNAMVGSNSSLQGGLVAALVLFIVNYLVKRIIYKSKIINDLVEDKPEILIHDGKLDFKTLARLEISSSELEEVVREHGVQHFSDVKLAMMEIDGNISVISGEKALKQTHHKRKIHKTLGTVNN
ncbi:DUF421 domain-containing protein [Flavobacterium wongokense]|uniref:DUF421 domain-containing protein n=1 Tax=Flavobacterium wongokense TaxID=2910674 RepID=UPI001F375FF4|nr:YetF domain-containing protein [Flavobacterium sp. WG47]MCF6132282.1 DUF421 domain-containing protein [Flavobacterium sp. WG47]